MTTELIQGGQSITAPADLRALCEQAWDIKREMDLLGERLDLKKDEISAALDGEGTILRTDVFRVTVGDTRKVSIADVKGLKTFLGTRFTELVKETTAYKPTKALVGILDDREHAKHAGLPAFLSIAKGRAVRILADGKKDDEDD